MEVAVGETSARVLTEPKPIVTEVCKNKEVTILEEKLLEANKKIMPYALTLVGSYADAEDLCQTTMMKLIKNQDKFLQSNTPTAYAKTILKNTFVDNYRKQKKIVPLSTESLESSYNFDASCEYEEMLRCLEKHNEVERTIDVVGLRDRASYYPTQLSGGQKRKLSLGIAFIGQSKIVFLGLCVYCVLYQYW